MFSYKNIGRARVPGQGVSLAPYTPCLLSFDLQDQCVQYQRGLKDLIDPKPSQIFEILIYASASQGALHLLFFLREQAVYIFDESVRRILHLQALQISGLARQKNSTSIHSIRQWRLCEKEISN
jgi:hypothetical protein